MPPLKTFGNQAGFQGAVHAAVATMGAVFAQLRDGEGQHVEVSVQESLTGILELPFGFWHERRMMATRLGRKPIQPMESMQCKDGWIFLCCVEEHQWQNFVHVMGDPEWAGEEIFSDRLKRGENWEALRIFLEEWVGQQTVLDLYKKVQARAGPVRAGVDDGRPARLRAFEGARFFRRHNASHCGNAQVSRRAAQVPCDAVGDPTSRADPGTT